MLKSLPPVGNPISISVTEVPEGVFRSVFGKKSVFLYGSGTMALAASLVAARESRKISSPEVLLPAYTCPDLISAAIFSGLKPILVDLEHNRPWMDLENLRSKLSPRTVAVIAAHFLGTTERIAQIRHLLAETGVVLIEDSAQLFPKSRTDDVWQGDFSVLSFGRGKPVSLLQGGAVICNNDSLEKNLPKADKARLTSEVIGPSLIFKVKAILYNMLLTPHLYSVIETIPFLHLGETKYKPLNVIDVANEYLSSLLASNINAYINRDLSNQSEIASMLSKLNADELIDLPKITSNDASLPLLRYPLLIRSPKKRDILFSTLNEAGLGPSKMYQVPLPEIDGLGKMFGNNVQCKEAKVFSQKLLTLPCHPGVTSNEIEHIEDILSKLLSEK